MTSTVGVGDLVDAKYRIIRLIGEGGWGIVFEGENVRTLKRVAVKVLRARPDLTAEIRARFEREAQAAGRIGSEHIVEVFDLGSLADGSQYMVMELLSGEDLASRIQRTGALPPVLACRLAVQLLDGLTAAHDAGILHRDLKPENLFLVPTRTGEEFVKILDFGISKFTSPDTSNVTMTGAVLGSPFYMAPEQARGLKHVDARTDLYSVGVLLFESVTGRVPFEGDNFNDLMFKIALSPRPDPLSIRPDIDPHLGQIIVRAISADPNDRYVTAHEFRQVLVDWLESQGVPSVRPPELRRAARTPHNRNGHLTPSTPRPASTPRGQAAGAAGGTPLVAAASLDPRGSAHARRGIVAAIAIMIALVATGVVALRYGRGREHPAQASTPEVPPSMPGAPPAPENTIVHPVALAPPGNETQVAAATAEPPPAAEARGGPSVAVQRGTGHPGAGPARAGAASSKGQPSASGASSPQEAAAPPAATPPAPPASTPASVGTVEGRAIQTGL